MTGYLTNIVQRSKGAVGENPLAPVLPNPFLGLTTQTTDPFEQMREQTFDSYRPPLDSTTSTQPSIVSGKHWSSSPPFSPRNEKQEPIKQSFPKKPVRQDQIKPPGNSETETDPSELSGIKETKVIEKESLVTRKTVIVPEQIQTEKAKTLPLKEKSSKTRRNVPIKLAEETISSQMKSEKPDYSGEVKKKKAPYSNPEKHYPFRAQPVESETLSLSILPAEDKSSFVNQETKQSIKLRPMDKSLPTRRTAIQKAKPVKKLTIGKIKVEVVKPESADRRKDKRLRMAPPKNATPAPSNLGKELTYKHRFGLGQL